MGTVPGSSVRIHVRVSRLGKRRVGNASIVRRCVRVHHGSHEGMAEPDMRPHLEQTGRRRGIHRRFRDPEPACGGPDQVRISGRLRGGDEEQASAVVRQRDEAPSEALLDSARHGDAIRQPEAARERCRCPRPWQLQQREWIPARLGNDSIADRRVEPARCRRREQGSGVSVAEGSHGKLGQTRQLRNLDRVARDEEEYDRLRGKAPGHEAQDLRGSLVEPVGIVEQAHQRLPLRDVGEQAEDGKSDKKSVGRPSRAQAERRRKRIALRLREAFEPVQEWRADLVEARERQLHFRLDAGRARDPAPGGPAEHVVQQGRLPDARGPTKDKRGVVPCRAPAINWSRAARSSRRPWRPWATSFSMGAMSISPISSAVGDERTGRVQRVSHSTPARTATDQRCHRAREPVPPPVAPTGARRERGGPS